MISHMLLTMVLAAIAAFMYTFQPSVLDPVIWENPFPLPALINAYSPNDILVNTELLCEGGCTAPESIAIDPLTGTVYARYFSYTVMTQSYFWTTM